MSFLQSSCQDAEYAFLTLVTTSQGGRDAEILVGWKQGSSGVNPQEALEKWMVAVSFAQHQVLASILIAVRISLMLS